MILLCTAMSAWSYTTGTVEIINTEDDRGHCFDYRTGIEVTGPEELETSTCWTIVGDVYGLTICVPFGYVITSVWVYGDVNNIKCDNLIYNYNSEQPYLSDWVQDGTFKYYEYINFKAKSDNYARISAVRITYHEHEISPNDSWAETCVTAGKKASCTCADCGPTYYDDGCTSEVEKEEDLILPIDPTKHVLVKRAAVGATDTEDGYTVDHWHCQACGKNFADEECTEQITDNVIIRARNRDWLCFTANTDNSTVALKKNGEPYEAALEFTTTETDWHTYTFGQTITLTDAGDKVYFRNASEDLAKGFSKDFMNDYYQFAMTGSIAASGNVMSLLDKTCLATSFPYDDGKVETPEDFNYFVNLFSGCESLTSAPELPAIKLTPYCYMWMSKDCTGLTSAPELPAMALSDWCYGGMFEGCTGLKQAPALPANTMKPNCYAVMFKGCTGLTEAPELSAMTLAGSCYSEMFENCTSLKTAPELPATTLALQCYSQMFSGCTKLSQVKVAFTEWTNNTTYNWLKDVASTGTFVCPIGLDKTQTGASYIPEGWTICSPITISAAGMATLCLPFDAVCSEGVTAFYATAVDNEGVTFSPVNDGLIEAGQGVLVKGDAGSYLVEKTTGAEAPTTNYMVGVTSETERQGTDNYILVNGSEGVGFYRWDTGSLAAYKAYLPVHEGVTPSSSIAIRFDDGSTTIDDVISEPENEVIYDLQGRRVMNADKGLYIVNGKKVLKR